MNLETAKESELHDYFYQKLIGDFYMIHEVKGTCNINHPAISDPRVIADFLLYPRQHLLDIGFADTWFAAEIKTTKSRWAEGLRQAFWYTVSTFKVKDRLIIPGFALAYRPNGDRYGESGIAQGEAISFGHLNAGVVKIYEGQHYNWEILFGCDRYARSFNDSCRFAAGYHVNEGRKNFWIKPGNGQRICSHTGIDGVPA